MKDGRIVENRDCIKEYLSKLRFVLENRRCSVYFQELRNCDQDRTIKHTNKFTVNKLFPDENIVNALKRELGLLEVVDYLYSLKDKKFPKKAMLSVFAKKYDGEYVYIKIRVETIVSVVVVISFHFSSTIIEDDEFVYCEVEK